MIDVNLERRHVFKSQDHYLTLHAHLIVPHSFVSDYPAHVHFSCFLKRPCIRILQSII